MQESLREVCLLILSHGHSEVILHAVRREPLAMYHILRDVKFKDPTVRYFNNDLLQHKQLRFHASDDSPQDLPYTERTNTEKADNDPILMARYIPYTRRVKMPSLHSSTRSFYAVEEYYIPLPTDITFLKALHEISIQVDTSDLFDNKVIQILIQYAWTMYGYPYHYYLSLLYVALLLLVTFSNYTFHSWIQSITHFTAELAVIGLIFLINSYFFMLETLQLFQVINDNSLLYYISDIQKYLDWGTHSLIYIGFVYRLTQLSETPESAAIMSVTIILMFLKALYFLRPFKSTGPLIRMIFCILYSIKELMIILILIIFGFSQAFYLLSYDNDQLDFSSPTDAIINAFLYMMGQSQLSQMQGSSSPKLAQFILCLFIFVSAILLLNLLIALMNNSYTAIQEMQIAEWHRECAKIMVEQWRPWPPKLKKYAYYLVRQDDRKNEFKTKQSLQEYRLNRIESTLETLVSLKRSLDTMRELQDARLAGVERNIDELKYKIK